MTKTEKRKWGAVYECAEDVLKELESYAASYHYNNHIGHYAVCNSYDCQKTRTKMQNLRDALDNTFKKGE